MKIIIVSCSLMIALVSFSGCLTSPAVYDSAEGVIHAHYEYSEGWSPNQGCYEQVTGYVYNTGEVAVDSVELHFNLINSRTGTIRDSSSIFIGSIQQGATTTYETELDGECTQDYRVDFSFGE